AAKRVVAVGQLGDAATEPHVADDRVVRVDLGGSSGDADAIARRSLAGDRDVWGADMDRPVQVDDAGDVEDDDARSTVFARLAQRAGAGVGQARHDKDLPAAATDGPAATALGAGEGGNLRLRKVV